MPDPGRETYASLMAPAFTEVFYQDVPPLVARPAERAIKVAECQIAAKTMLEQVDWEKSGLAMHPFRRPGADNPEAIPEYLTPREYANRLLDFAFSDAEALLKHASDFLNKRQLDPEHHGSVLTRSKNLLLLASLSETSKQAVINSMTYHEIRQHMVDVPQYKGEAFELRTAANGVPVVQWQPELQEWMTNAIALTEANGCPALGINIRTTDGTYQGLLSYFWERLVRYVYKD